MNKRPIAIHQFSPSVGYGDAISNNIIDLIKLLRSWGYEAEIYTGYADPRVAKYCKPYTTYQYERHHVLIYHYGTASSLTQFLLKWPEQLVLLYHNVTPAHFFEFEDAQLAKILKQAREDLKALSGAAWAIGDSDYNCQELRRLGFKDVQTIPYLLNFSNLDRFSNTKTERQILQWLNDDYVNILFTGRLVPNKRQDDLIRLLRYYQQLISPRARLLLVGLASPRYKAMLEILAEKLGVAQDVHFVGHVELKDGFTAYYKGASVFVSMSEHEGFGVPLLESMYFNLPVIAYATAAVPEIMGDAGILVTEKRYDVMGELINLLVTDPQFREQIILKQKEHLQSFDRSCLENRFRQWVLELEKRFN